jgi:hypothetical protein
LTRLRTLGTSDHPITEGGLNECHEKGKLEGVGDGSQPKHNHPIRYQLPNAGRLVFNLVILWSCESKRSGSRLPPLRDQSGQNKSPPVEGLKI